MNGPLVIVCFWIAIAALVYLACEWAKRYDDAKEFRLLEQQYRMPAVEPDRREMA